MSWHAPELQLLHRFNSIQSLAAAFLPDSVPPELVNCHQRAKDYRTDSQHDGQSLNLPI